MPQAKCGWQGCTNDAAAEVHLDAGATICPACGAEKTERRTYKLCETHDVQYAESGDVTLLLLSAKEA